MFESLAARRHNARLVAWNTAMAAPEPRAAGSMHCSKPPLETKSDSCEFLQVPARLSQSFASVGGTTIPGTDVVHHDLIRPIR
jgi:hypothetical protein